MKNQFFGRNFLVFGASGSIGSEVVRALLERGAEVTAVFHTQHKLEQFEGKLDWDGIVNLYSCDVTDVDAMHRLKDELARNEMIFDGIINAVGNCPPHGFKNEVSGSIFNGHQTRERLDFNLNLYLNGTYNIFEMKSLVCRGGCFLNYGTGISSFLGKIPEQVNAGPYAAAKAAQVELVRWVRNSTTVLDFGFKIHLLNIGGVDTPFHEGIPAAQKPPMLTIKQVVKATLKAVNMPYSVDRNVLTVKQRIGRAICTFLRYQAP